MNDEIKVLLFRSVRELMLNIVKHAQARNARVTIRRENDDVSIAVEDDGVGIKDLSQDSRLKVTAALGSSVLESACVISEAKCRWNRAMAGEPGSLS